jgi:aminoglycoside 3-N-acetyltransferase
MSFDSLKETLKNMAPPVVRHAARDSLKGLRNLRNTVQRKQGRSISQADIVTALRDLGIRPGDTVLVHSSLSRLGFVAGGVDTVIAALQEAVGPDGTLGAPTFWVADPHTAEEGTIFDAGSGASCLGIISDRIRRLPGAVRSLHPTHSASFAGPRAQSLAGEHHFDETPTGAHSPFRKLADVNGKILLLGASIEYLTSFHTIEDEIENFPFPIYGPERKRFKVRTADGRELELYARLHDAETARLRQCIKMEPHLESAGIMKKTKLGAGSAILFEASRLHDTLHSLAKRGITIYSPDARK